MSSPDAKDVEHKRRRKTLGLLLKDRRSALKLSQLEVAKHLGVEPAYISAIELDRRRPSLPLVRRLADVLGLKRERLLLLSHPEAKLLIGENRQNSTQSTGKDRAWRDFKANESLLLRHNVKPEELKLLSRMRRLGEIRHPRDFLHILTAIRQAIED
jgi:transcriptional regulator with XRE-family HTH domain